MATWEAWLWTTDLSNGSAKECHHKLNIRVRAARPPGSLWMGWSVGHVLISESSYRMLLPWLRTIKKKKSTLLPLWRSEVWIMMWSGPQPPRLCRRILTHLFHFQTHLKLWLCHMDLYLLLLGPPFLFLCVSPPYAPSVFFSWQFHTCIGCIVVISTPH